MADSEGSSRNDGKRAEVLYREDTPLGVVYHIIMVTIIVALAAGTLVFALTGVYTAALPTALPLVFVVWLYATFRKVTLKVTAERLTVRFWSKTLRVWIEEIESVEIKDSVVLPKPYRDHVTIFWGYCAWSDLKVALFRRHSRAVDIRKKGGELVIVTPKDPEKLHDLLCKRIGAAEQ